MTGENGFIEQRIVDAIQKLLTGRVNELLKKLEFFIPVIEFGDDGSGQTVSPIITLSACERTEKERIIRQDAYSLNITFTLPETPESGWNCYAYAGALSRAFYDEPTLGGLVDRAVIVAKKFIEPKKPNCGDGWDLIISVRLTVEGMGNES
jgi:hypothetical protein